MNQSNIQVLPKSINHLIRRDRPSVVHHDHLEAIARVLQGHATRQARRRGPGTVQVGMTTEKDGGGADVTEDGRAGIRRLRPLRDAAANVTQHCSPGIVEASIVFSIQLIWNGNEDVSLPLCTPCDTLDLPEQDADGALDLRNFLSAAIPSGSCQDVGRSPRSCVDEDSCRFE